MTDRIEHKINQLTVRIYEQNDKINDSISTSELNKINKIIKKLTKEKQKLYDKLYNKNEFEATNPIDGEDEE